MKIKFKTLHAFLVALVLYADSASAETFHFLANQGYFGGLSMGDGYWGNVDYVTPGFNPQGGASDSVMSYIGLYAYWSGGQFVLDAPMDAAGMKNMTSLHLDGDMNITPLGHPNLLGAPITADLTFGYPATVTVQSDQTFQSEFVSGFQNRSLGGFYVKRGQDPASLFTDPLVVAHFNSVIPALPDDWSMVAFERTIATDIPSGAVVAYSSLTSYSTVPLPAPLCLLATAGFGLSRMRRQGVLPRH